MTPSRGRNRHRELAAAIACSAIVVLPLWAQGQVVTPRADAAFALGKPRVVVPTDSLSEVIVAFAVSRRGIIAVGDLSGRIALFDDGKRRGYVGGRGRGPGEFTSINDLVWVGDTLYALDAQQRRVTSFTAAGRPITTVHWRGSGTPTGLHEAGARLAVAIRRFTRRDVRYGGSTQSVNLPITHFAFLEDSSFVEPPGGLRDSTGFTPFEGTLGADCEDPSGVVRILHAPFPPRGKTATFVGDSLLAVAVPGSYELRLQRLRGGAGRIIRAAQPAVKLSDADWERAASPYLSFAAGKRGVTCRPAYARPAIVPPIRGIALDDRGRIWTEVSTATGPVFDVIAPNSPTAYRVTLPGDRDPRLPVVVRRGAVYTINRDADGLQEIVVVPLQERRPP